MEFRNNFYNNRYILFIYKMYKVNIQNVTVKLHYVCVIHIFCKFTLTLVGTFVCLRISLKITLTIMYV